MTGEMSRSEVTREAYPLWFAAADQIDGATVEPFDHYQGPYVLIPTIGRFFLFADRGYAWWSERFDCTSQPFTSDLFYEPEEEDDAVNEGVDALLNLIEDLR